MDTETERENQQSGGVCSQCLPGIQSGQDTQEETIRKKAELSLLFRALEIMEIAKEEKKILLQSDFRNVSWGVHSANTNCLVWGGSSCPLWGPFDTFIPLSK